MAEDKDRLPAERRNDIDKFGKRDGQKAAPKSPPPPASSTAPAAPSKPANESKD